MLLVFSGVFTFLVDAYPLYAASALAANSFARSTFAAAFPLFGVQSEPFPSVTGAVDGCSVACTLIVAEILISVQQIRLSVGYDSASVPDCHNGTVSVNRTACTRSSRLTNRFLDICSLDMARRYEALQSLRLGDRARRGD